MAKLDDTTVPAALQPYLEPGEQLTHWAFGVKQPHILLIVPLVALGILPGLIVVMLLTRNYIVGLTDRRFIALRFSGNLNVKETLDYARAALPPVKASTGPLFTHIAIRDPRKPFVAKFHRLGMPNNRLHSQAIEAALTGKALAA